MKQKATFNPLTFLWGFTFIMVVLTPILMYTFDVGASGGEQKPLSTLSSMIEVFVYGTALICSSILLFYWKRVKKNWWFIILLVLTLLPALDFLWQNLHIPYGVETTSFESQGSLVKKKTEFYNLTKQQIRSVSFWKNGKKDSVWIIYSESGQIISQNIYRNDSLIVK